MEKQASNKILVTIVVLLMIASGIVIYIYNSNDKELAVEDSEGNEIHGLQVEGSELYKYTNNDLGFELSYPSSWKIVGEFPLGIKFDPKGNTKEDQSGSEDDVNIGVSSYGTYGGSEDINFEAWIQKEINAGTFGEKKQIDINKNYNGVEVKNLISNTSKKSVFLISKDKERVATFILPANYDEDGGYVKLIENFKFID